MDIQQQQQQQQQQPSSSSLSPLLPILNAFNHRHHNQHRLAHWWPVFRILRRTLRALVHDLSASSTSTPSSSRPFRREAAASPLPPPPPPRAIWLSKHFIPRAYIAFSQLAADNQHAPLGLLLLAILARVHAVLAQLLDHTATTTSTSTSTTPSTTTAKPPSSSYNRSIDAEAAAAANQDKGIAISRDAHHSRPVIQPTERLRTVHQQQQQQTASSSSTRHSSDEPPRGEVAHEPEAMTAKPSRTKSKEASLKDDKKKKKKKRGKGDELSSLFGSLA